MKSVISSYQESERKPLSLRHSFKTTFFYRVFILVFYKLLHQCRKFAKTIFSATSNCKTVSITSSLPSSIPKQERATSRLSHFNLHCSGKSSAHNPRQSFHCFFIVYYYPLVFFYPCKVIFQVSFSLKVILYVASKDRD